MKKNKLHLVGIVTLYDNINIGNKLQNYAVQEVLKHYAENVVTLSYSEASVLAPDMGWKGRIIAQIGFPKELAIKKRAIIKRRNKFEDFSNTFLNVESSRSFNGFDDDIASNFDAIVVGSDQVWHNWSKTKAEIDYFLLRFVPNNKKICFSPSFGSDNVSCEFEEIYRNGLNGFQKLSCREETGCRLIKELTGRSADLLVDPTMMLSAERWNSIAKKPQYLIPENYMLLYAIGGVSEAKKTYIEKMARDKELEIVDILNLDFPEYYTTSPDEFLYLVQNAQYICTNSFHACVFSIIFKRNFYWFNREDNIGIGASNRQKTLVDKFHLKRINESWDFSSVDDMLAVEQTKVWNYLDSAFSNIDRND